MSADRIRKLISERGCVRDIDPKEKAKMIRSLFQKERIKLEENSRQDARGSTQSISSDLKVNKPIMENSEKNWIKCRKKCSAKFVTIEK